MQATREHILHILKERYQATVDELSRELGLTAVTIRHHLETLRDEGLVAPPTVRRRKAPGRPKYVYTLTEKANAFFPKRYSHLASLLLSEVHSRLASAEEMDQVMKHIGERIASQAVIPDEGDFEARLAATVEFLDDLGYMARWERCEEGNEDAGDYMLHVANCPYEQVARQSHEICTMDLTLVTCLVGVSPRRISWRVQDNHQCTYAFSPPTK
jgi:predicted ArsR family transcriptional regulator